MPVNDDLGKRMKEFYENRSKTYLVRRMPVAIRIDGRAFHTFTKHMQRPFDHILMKTMQDTMMYLCKEVQGCVLGYQQSDEITLILVDYAKLDSDAWFDYSVQKLCSLSASMATLAFNKALEANLSAYIDEKLNRLYQGVGEWITPEEDAYAETINQAVLRGAMFDARCFNIPVEEVTNLIYWRQLDATRNSIQMVAQANFPHKELQHLNTSNLQNKLMLEKDINWSQDFTPTEKRGCCCIKDADGKWFIDENIPIFKGEGREYIEKLVQVSADETN